MLFVFGNGAQAQSPVAGTTRGWELIFWSFLIKNNSRIKRSQVVFMGKFGPIALNDVYDLFLLVIFFWDTLYIMMIAGHFHQPKILEQPTKKSRFLYSLGC